jgi:nitrogen regulatory protein P-II 2
MNTSIQTVTLKRVTIIAESLLEARLLADLERSGAKGFTITEARGRGSRGVRASEWEGQNLKLETIVSPEVADRIMLRMVESYFPNYAVIAYLENVEVVRGEKYV